MMTTDAELDALRGMVFTYVLTADERQLTDVAAYISQPDMLEATPLPVGLCDQLHRELVAIAAILAKAAEKFPTAPQRSDVRKHLAALKKWIAELEMHHVQPRLARFSQEGD